MLELESVEDWVVVIVETSLSVDVVAATTNHESMSHSKLKTDSRTELTASHSLAIGRSGVG